MCRYKGSSAFWEGIQAYGIYCWRLEILWDGLTEDEANFYEGLEIRDNDAMYPYGYNLEEGGENYTRSEKTKQKMSDVMKGEKNPFYGKKHSEETRQEISKNHARFWKGKKRSAESRRKMAENNPMKCPETRRKHAEAMKVRTLSEESRQKIVDAKRSPSYALAYQAFCALPKTLTLPEIRKILIDQFQDVSKATVRRWTKNWYRDNAASELHPNLDAKRISGTPKAKQVYITF